MVNIYLLVKEPGSSIGVFSYAAANFKFYKLPASRNMYHEYFFVLQNSQGILSAGERQSFSLKTISFRWLHRLLL